jgi:virginiamycin B lyase
MVVGKDGSVYSYDLGTGKLDRLKPGKTSAQGVDIPVNTNQHFGMQLSKSGEVFFTVDKGLGSYSPRHNAVSIQSLGADTADVTQGPDNALWFTEPAANKIGRLTLNNKGNFARPGTVTLFDVPTPNAGAVSIIQGPQKDLWFTEDLVGKVAQITFPTKGGAPVITEFDVPAGPSSQPLGLALGPDKNVWFAESVANKIGTINENTRAITEFDVPTPNAQAFWITPGSKSDLWFTERTSGKIGRIIAPSGLITEITVPSGAAANLTGIVTEKKKAVWFTEADIDKVGRLSIK